jgi:hypothetical protein
MRAAAPERLRRRRGMPAFYQIGERPPSTLIDVPVM